MPLPSRADLQIYRGDSVALVLQVWSDEDHTVPVDLSGAEIRAQVRATTESSVVLADFEALTTDNAITLRLTPKQSSDLTASCVWDVQADWSGGLDEDVTTFVYGSIVVTPDVTRVGV